ncbi:MAG: Adenylate cyclase, class 2 (Thermophilic) [Parcubacteria group bacterium GW2011_GWE2_39_37]|uniref:Adenylate cyclase, class 2 (Thermophilic) n=1 Tax=Candidatus Falkowbacteria bacterium GW2011_GWF2_39_8 TaxID=1618642 RepID=A0A0G0SG16_9BACT|nr:MAG: Adenylate cyclase, class 2 (Thermophilic) [Parcubacteria group bacterium GW2011_GWE2_39_37]KKR33635.1 MAG: Adenylate cyclase, class 2 (Thermophilic) [Candidatus Falkowbacteria bacterium GW2011_GWF2_39_8]
MPIEFETQILDINPGEIIEKLRVLGAEEKEEVFQKRWIFDIVCLNSEQPGLGEWIRVRQAGDKVDMTYKRKKDFSITGTEEIELAIDDFDKAAALLSKLSCFTGQYFQENRRKQFFLNDLEFDIDYWPNIPPFLEIEGKSEEDVKRGMKLLGLEEKENGHFGLINIYAKHGIKLHDYKELKF